MLLRLSRSLSMFVCFALTPFSSTEPLRGTDLGWRVCYVGWHVDCQPAMLGRAQLEVAASCANCPLDAWPRTWQSVHGLHGRIGELHCVEDLCKIAGVLKLVLCPALMLCAPAVAQPQWRSTVVVTNARRIGAGSMWTYTEVQLH